MSEIKDLSLAPSGADKIEIPSQLTVYKVKNIREAIEIAL